MSARFPASYGQAAARPRAAGPYAAPQRPLAQPHFQPAVSGHPVPVGSSFGNLHAPARRAARATGTSGVVPVVGHYYSIVTADESKFPVEVYREGHMLKKTLRFKNQRALVGLVGHCVEVACLQKKAAPQLAKLELRNAPGEKIIHCWVYGSHLSPSSSSDPRANIIGTAATLSPSALSDEDACYAVAVGGVKRFTSEGLVELLFPDNGKTRNAPFVSIVLLPQPAGGPTWKGRDVQLVSGSALRDACSRVGLWPISNTKAEGIGDIPPDIRDGSPCAPDLLFYGGAVGRVRSVDSKFRLLVCFPDNGRERLLPPSAVTLFQPSGDRVSAWMGMAVRVVSNSSRWKDIFRAEERGQLKAVEHPPFETAVNMMGRIGVVTEVSSRHLIKVRFHATSGTSMFSGGLSSIGLGNTTVSKVATKSVDHVSYYFVPSLLEPVGPGVMAQKESILRSWRIICGTSSVTFGVIADVHNYRLKIDGSRHLSDLVAYSPYSLPLSAPAPPSAKIKGNCDGISGGDSRVAGLAGQIVGLTTSGRYVLAIEGGSMRVDISPHLTIPVGKIPVPLLTDPCRSHVWAPRGPDSVHLGLLHGGVHDWQCGLSGRVVVVRGGMHAAAMLAVGIGMELLKSSANPSPMVRQVVSSTLEDVFKAAAPGIRGPSRAQEEREFLKSQSFWGGKFSLKEKGAFWGSVGIVQGIDYSGAVNVFFPVANTVRAWPLVALRVLVAPSDPQRWIPNVVGTKVRIIPGNLRSEYAAADLPVSSRKKLEKLLAVPFNEFRIIGIGSHNRVILMPFLRNQQMQLNQKFANNLLATFSCIELLDFTAPDQPVPPQRPPRVPITLAPVRQATAAHNPRAAPSFDDPVPPPSFIGEDKWMNDLPPAFQRLVKEGLPLPFFRQGPPEIPISDRLTDCGSEDGDDDDLEIPGSFIASARGQGPGMGDFGAFLAGAPAEIPPTAADFQYNNDPDYPPEAFGAFPIPEIPTDADDAYDCNNGDPKYQNPHDYPVVDSPELYDRRDDNASHPTAIPASLVGLAGPPAARANSDAIKEWGQIQPPTDSGRNEWSPPSGNAPASYAPRHDGSSGGLLAPFTVAPPTLASNACGLCGREVATGKMLFDKWWHSECFVVRVCASLYPRCCVSCVSSLSHTSVCRLWRSIHQWRWMH